MSGVVVVESPAKAKTINRYLGADYTVLASFGHVRDLPPKEGSVRPDEDFAMDWELGVGAGKHVKAIRDALKGTDTLYLATDPDREGEAISWHVYRLMQDYRALDGKQVRRVVFNEITKTAIQEAFRHPRDLDDNLVHAYLARRALDYLYGFTLSPVLWRKLPGSRSAGRVQSVALRLICTREAEIEVFVAREYWSINATMITPEGETFGAFLQRLDGKKVDKFAIADQGEAMRLKALIEAADFHVSTIERKQTKRHPAPPFTTSTLQQDAANKLYFSAKKTMQIAQRLYEGVSLNGETTGLITYMRTDGINMAGDAIARARQVIGDEYGADYVPASPRMYKNKAKNAQEAHEAIRPTDMARRPEQLARILDKDQLKLYDLIWKRTMASQMESAVLDQVAVDIDSRDGALGLRTTGSIVTFSGFFKVYQAYKEGDDRDPHDKENNKENDKDRHLPPMNEGDRTTLVGDDAVKPEQHFTQPPPRYSEATLVKTLEEYGIGRPSTYASIISVLQDRDYVRLEGRRFFPENRGRFVTSFLTNFFQRYVAYDFTADLESKLDEVSNGTADWKKVLGDFWEPFCLFCEDVKKLANRAIIDDMDAALGQHFFPAREDGTDPRQCPACAEGRLGLKPSRQSGFFIGCSRWPECNYTRSAGPAVDGQDDDAQAAGPKSLGTDPASGLEVSLRKGPYGPYVQLGETPPQTTSKTKDKPPAPKRTSLPKGMQAADLTLDQALKLLSLPRNVGAHPETGEMIVAGLGRFGPYLLYQGNYISLKHDDVLEVGLNRAVSIIADAPKKPPAISLGVHPDDGKPVVQKSGRWGPYVQHGRTRATLPKGDDSITLEAALELLLAKGGSKTRTRTKAKGNVKTSRARSV